MSSHLPGGVVGVIEEDTAIEEEVDDMTEGNSTVNELDSEVDFEFILVVVGKDKT